MTEQDAADADVATDADGSATEAGDDGMDGEAAASDADAAAAGGVTRSELEAVLQAVADDSADGESVDEPVEPSLREHVETADDETLAREVSALVGRVRSLEHAVADHESEVEDLEDEVDDLESRLARKQADFQNYKQRQQQKLEDEKARATEDLVSRLLEVRDNLARALGQDADVDIRDGVESTLRGFDEELERENVAVIEPEPGEAVDPQRHEVLMRVESDQPADTVAGLHRPGYEMAGKVLRAAQVTVSDGPAETPADGTDDGD